MKRYQYLLLSLVSMIVPGLFLAISGSVPILIRVFCAIAFIFSLERILRMGKSKNLHNK